MIEDKIKILLKDMNELRESLRGIKKDIKQEEKIEDAQYLELKKAYKDLRDQMKGFEEENKTELVEDDFYNKLREAQMEKEEKIAHAREALFENIEKLPQKAFELDVETADGRVKMQCLPDMRVFLNGKEERKTF